MLKRRGVLFVIILIIVLLLVYAGVNVYVKYTSNKTCYKQIDNLPNCDVAIVFGAGISGTEPGRCLTERLDAGIDLIKNNKVKKLLLTGDNGRDEYDEITAMKLYCYKNGVDTSKIYLDYAGFDTYSSMYRAKHIFNVEEAVLVTQNFHLDRAVFLGNSLGVKSYGYIADQVRSRGYYYYSFRETIAVLKSVLNIITHRKPKYLGEKVDINGESNYSK